MENSLARRKNGTKRIKSEVLVLFELYIYLLLALPRSRWKVQSKKLSLLNLLHLLV